MTNRRLSRVKLLEMRLALVARASALNAEALKLAQTLGAAEMDALRLQLELRGATDSEQLVRNLLEVEMKADAIRASQAECEDRIAAADAKVEEIDRLIANAGDA